MRGRKGCPGLVTVKCMSLSGEDETENQTNFLYLDRRQLSHGQEGSNKRM